MAEKLREITPKEAAMVLTQEGFLKWYEGKPLEYKDFKDIAHYWVAGEMQRKERSPDA